MKAFYLVTSTPKKWWLGIKKENVFGTLVEAQNRFIDLVGEAPQEHWTVLAVAKEQTDCTAWQEPEPRVKRDLAGRTRSQMTPGHPDYQYEYYDQTADGA